MEQEPTLNTGETKKCPKCSESIQKAAKKCKHCGADLRNWFMRHKVITVIAVLVLIVIIGSSGNKGNAPKQTGSNKDNQNRLAEAPKNEEKINKVGEAVQLGHAIVTVNKVDFSQGGPYIKPAEGNEWVSLNLTIENTDSKEQYVTTLGQMFVRDGEGNSYQVASTDKVVDNVNNSLDGTVIAKSKRTGWVGFEIKKGAKGLQFQYNGSMWGGGNIIFDMGR